MKKFDSKISIFEKKEYFKMIRKVGYSGIVVWLIYIAMIYRIYYLLQENIDKFLCQSNLTKIYSIFLFLLVTLSFIFYSSKHILIIDKDNLIISKEFFFIKYSKKKIYFSDLRVVYYSENPINFLFYKLLTPLIYSINSSNIHFQVDTGKYLDKDYYFGVDIKKEEYEKMKEALIKILGEKRAKEIIFAIY